MKIDPKLVEQWLRDWLADKADHTPWYLYAAQRAADHALEEAAKVCREKVKRDADYMGRFGGYGDFMGTKTGDECAAAIEALKGTKE